MKIARFVTGNHKIMSRYRSYHGASFGAVSLTGDPRRLPSEPAVPGAIKAPDPYAFRSTIKDPMQSVEYIDEMLYLEGDTVGAVVIEPVVGSNGILVPPDEYMPALREVCNDHGALLVVDEVMCGFGRTGEWFATDHWDFEPDILTMAKGLTGAYQPLAATIVSDEIARFFEGDEMFCHGHTYAGHPVACAAANAAVDEYRTNNLIEHSSDMESTFRSMLEDLKTRHPCVGEVRGLGMFWGIELVRDPETKEPFATRFDKLRRSPGILQEFSARCWERGMHQLGIVNTLIVAPPLIATKEDIEEGISILDDELEWVDDQID